MDTPSHKLAARILERLVDEGLMTADNAKKIQSPLAAGKIRAEDWRLPIELGEEKMKAKS